MVLTRKYMSTSGNLTIYESTRREQTDQIRNEQEAINNEQDSTVARSTLFYLFYSCRYISYIFSLFQSIELETFRSTAETIASYNDESTHFFSLSPFLGLPSLSQWSPSLYAYIPFLFRTCCCQRIESFFFFSYSFLFMATIEKVNRLDVRARIRSFGFLLRGCPWRASFSMKTFVQHQLRVDMDAFISRQLLGVPLFQISTGLLPAVQGAV